MRVFIAGATGALGIPLVKRLVAAGHEVIGLTRQERSRDTLQRLGAQPVIGDALDGDALERIMLEARPTHVAHLLTALPKAGPMRPKDLEATNLVRVSGTANLIRGAISAGAKRIVAESFPAVYGMGGEQQGKLTEESPLPPVRAGVTAQMVESLRSLEQQMLAARDRIEAVVLRYGYLYGAALPSTLDQLEALRRRKLPMMRGASGVGSFLHIDDAAAATVAALERGPSGIYNIVDDQPVALTEFFTFAAEQIGAPAPRRLPRLLVRLVAPVVAEFSMTQLPLSNAKAKRELGFSPKFRTFREGLRDMA